ncbi:MAG TPA: hypothetical protein VFF54_08390 [Thermodesulfobacteriota bacterium]|nr:hypothetical protein [Thermodesulfobacteriota bacterium]
MGKSLPLLTRPDIERILRRLNFNPKSKSGSSHTQWEGYTKGQRRIVTVKKLQRDTDQYSNELMASMIRQSGLEKDEFYATDEKLAKRLGLR